MHRFDDRNSLSENREIVRNQLTDKKRVFRGRRIRRSPDCLTQRHEIWPKEPIAPKKKIVEDRRLCSLVGEKANIVHRNQRLAVKSGFFYIVYVTFSFYKQFHIEFFVEGWRRESLLFINDATKSVFAVLAILRSQLSNSHSVSTAFDRSAAFNRQSRKTHRSYSPPAGGSRVKSISENSSSKCIYVPFSSIFDHPQQNMRRLRGLSRRIAKPVGR